VAPYLLSKDPLQIDRHNVHLLGGYLGFGSTSVEVRAASAVDIALWDLFGQFVEQPIHQLLGGLSRDAIRVYNTCAGYNYNNRTVQQRLVKPNQVCADAEGPYDDQIAFMTRADELAHSLVDEGLHGDEDLALRSLCGSH
jgi:galactonate dehydratase